MQQAVASAVARNDRLLGVREMALKTGVTASTVSRYVKQHPQLGVKVNGQTKVRADEYLAHRLDNPGVEAPVLSEATPAKAIADLPTRAAKQRHEEVRAELAEMELAERKGELVRADDVREAIAACAQALRDDLLAIDVEFGERILAADDPRRAATMMADRNREAFEKFVDRLARESE